MTRLGIAVITQAVEDARAALPLPGANKDTRHRYNVALAHRAEARAFLTAPNAMLTFWCLNAGVMPENVLRYARRQERAGWTEVQPIPVVDDDDEVAA